MIDRDATGALVGTSDYSEAPGWLVPRWVRIAILVLASGAIGFGIGDLIGHGQVCTRVASSTAPSAPKQAILDWWAVWHQECGYSP